MHTVIETLEFVRSAKKSGMSDKEIDTVKLFVAHNPSAGNVIRGTGGARKIRIPARGRGKSGGYRVVTCFTGADFPVFLLDVYSKSEKDSLTQAEKNSIKTQISGILRSL